DRPQAGRALRADQQLLAGPRRSAGRALRLGAAPRAAGRHAHPDLFLAAGKDPAAAPSGPGRAQRGNIERARPLRLLFLVLLLACGPVLACEYPDEGNMPLRRAVAKVKYLPETEAWAASMHKAGAVVQYALRLDQPKQERSEER